MESPKNLYEQASYDLNQFRERRVAERRMKQRDTPDRRVSNMPWPPVVGGDEGDKQLKQ